MTKLLQPTWASEDFPVLVATVRLLDEHDGPDSRMIAQEANVSEGVVVRALRRLEGEYLTTEFVKDWWGMVILATVTSALPAARRVSGQWPDPDRIAQEVIAELHRTAEKATPERRQTIRGFLEALTESGGSLLGTIVGQAIRTGTGLP